MRRFYYETYKKASNMRPLLLTAIIVGVLVVSVTAPRPDKYFLETGDGLTKHHIIPANRLRDFYKTARQHGSKDVQEGLKETVQHIAKTNSYNGKEKQKLQEMRDGKVKLDKYAESQFFWMPGNLFKGPDPKHRTDDPKSEFETKARYIVPDETYKNLHDINKGMETFIKTKKPQDFIAVKEKIKHLQKSEPYAFEKSQWAGDCRTQCQIKIPNPAKPSTSKQSPPAKPATSQQSAPAKPATSQQSPPAKPATSQQSPPTKPATSQQSPPTKPATSQQSAPVKPATSQQSPPAKPATSQQSPPTKPATSQQSPPASTAQHKPKNTGTRRNHRNKISGRRRA